MSEPRRFYIRTFGCQMNEHDSERIAGLLAAEGMEHTDDLDEADVVVLNTCCVRENADNKLYGHLGRLKSLKERRPDLQIAVGGCLAQKDRDLIVERAGHVDVVFGTHNLAHAPALLERSRLEGHGQRHPIVEILEDTTGDFSHHARVVDDEARLHGGPNCLKRKPRDYGPNLPTNWLAIG